MDGWSFSAFAAVLAMPFFLAEFAPRVDARELIIIPIGNLFLARIASAIAQRKSNSDTAWVWGASALVAPMFSAFGIASWAFSLGEHLYTGREDLTTVVGGVLGWVLIWMLVTTVFVLPLCLVGAAVFTGLLKAALVVRRLATRT
jgi:hypothetical protein